MHVSLEDLPALALFARVVQLHSFTAAAEASGLAKAAVSQRIARLERRLGVQLLRRSTRRLSVTEAGMRLFEHASALLDVARAADAALDSGEALRGRLRLNAPGSIHRGVLARALGSFLAQHPSVSLSVTLDDRLVDLVTGDFDVVLRVVEAGKRTSVARKLGSDRVAVVGAPSYLAACPPLASPYDLVQHSCLRNSALPERVDWRLGRRGRRYTVPVPSRFESADFALLHAAALAGVGLLVTLALTVKEDLAEGRLREVLTSYQSEPLGIYALLAERAPAAPAARALVQHLARFFRSG
ncbi:MAG TPA: LysR substrate-binding domain-containing protein [Polyangiaceae bacterium]|nr:LysR substrate-binding domain-containing protein [Polyangiaceae bacterium]